tara:strand:+ start:7431 stop:7880 length:450 start_codon:yes stop_codon:yes gene_type:complete
MTKTYRNSFKAMRPHVGKQVGQEVFLATLNDSTAEEVNASLRSKGVKNPNGTDVVFSEKHLSQMKNSNRRVFTMVQNTAPYRFSEAFDLVTSMHQGGSYGPWYVTYYIPFALETGRPLWVPYSEAKEVVSMLKTNPGRAFTGTIAVSSS